MNFLLWCIVALLNSTGTLGKRPPPSGTRPSVSLINGDGSVNLEVLQHLAALRDEADITVDVNPLRARRRTRRPPPSGTRPTFGLPVTTLLNELTTTTSPEPVPSTPIRVGNPPPPSTYPSSTSQSSGSPPSPTADCPTGQDIAEVISGFGVFGISDILVSVISGDAEDLYVPSHRERGGKVRRRFRRRQKRKFGVTINLICQPNFCCQLGIFIFRSDDDEGSGFTSVPASTEPLGNKFILFIFCHCLRFLNFIGSVQVSMEPIPTPLGLVASQSAASWGTGTVLTTPWRTYTGIGSSSVKLDLSSRTSTPTRGSTISLLTPVVTSMGLLNPYSLVSPSRSGNHRRAASASGFEMQRLQAANASSSTSAPNSPFSANPPQNQSFTRSALMRSSENLEASDDFENSSARPNRNRYMWRPTLYFVCYCWAATMFAIMVSVFVTLCYL